LQIKSELVYETLRLGGFTSHGLM